VFDDDLTRAALMLLAGGERGAAVTFFAHLGQTLAEDSLAALGQYLSEIDEEYYTLLLAKTAVTRGIVIPTIYFPLHDLAQMDLPVDASLALSIARRESEFNIGIGSPVGALGLMQVMPATAEEVAGDLGLPYSKPRLTSDWEYNATIGAAYLAYLTEEFGPTPVMIAAGYNAGPSRPKRWIDERGDPRLLEMDVVDWIEHIPFRETRNYVMRVTESIPIYEARLSGVAGPVRFTELLLGSKPLLRPLARPAPQPSPASQVIRPVARPKAAFFARHNVNSPAATTIAAPNATFGRSVSPSRKMPIALAKTSCRYATGWTELASATSYVLISNQCPPAPVTQRTAIHRQSTAVIGSQNQTPAIVITTAPDVPVQKNDVAVVSLRAA
jgi:hypothetical protein